MPIIDGALWRSEEDCDFFWWCICMYGSGFKRPTLAGYEAIKPEDVRLAKSNND